MDLFSSEFDENTNLLPKDGTVMYYGKIMDYSKAEYFFNCLMETIEWKK